MDEELNSNGSIDNLLETLRTKGHITVNNIHIDESVNIMTNPRHKRDSSFFSLENVNKVVEVGKVVGKIAAIGVPVFLPKLLSSENPLLTRLGGNTNNPLLLTSSKNEISNKYIEKAKKENESGKFELFCESPKNSTPLWSFLLDLVEMDIGKEYQFTELNKFSEKFLQYLNRKDTILFYKESRDSIDKDKIEEILFKLSRGDKKDYLKIKIESISIKNVNEIKEIEDDKIEIIPADEL